MSNTTPERPEPYYIQAARRVLANGYMKVDGMLLDSFTASGMVQVWDALSPKNQALVLDKEMPFTKFVAIMWKLTR